MRTIVRMACMLTRPPVFGRASVWDNPMNRGDVHRIYSWATYLEQGRAAGFWPTVRGWLRWLKADGFAYSDMAAMAMACCENDDERRRTSASLPWLAGLWEILDEP